MLAADLIMTPIVVMVCVSMPILKLDSNEIEIPTQVMDCVPSIAQTNIPCALIISITIRVG